MTFKNVNDYLQKNICTHIILKNNINNRIKKLFIKFYVFINFNAFEKTFINRKFAQSLNLNLIILKIFQFFKIFDESKAVYNFIIYYVEIYFKTFLIKKNVRFIRFYVINLFH